MNDILDSYYWPQGRPEDPLSYFRAQLERWAAMKPSAPDLAAAAMEETRSVIKKLESQL